MSTRWYYIEEIPKNDRYTVKRNGTGKELKIKKIKKINKSVINEGRDIVQFIDTNYDIISTYMRSKGSNGPYYSRDRVYHYNKNTNELLQAAPWIYNDPFENKSQQSDDDTDSDSHDDDSNESSTASNIKNNNTNKNKKKKSSKNKNKNKNKSNNKNKNKKSKNKSKSKYRPPVQVVPTKMSSKLNNRRKQLEEAKKNKLQKQSKEEFEENESDKTSESNSENESNNDENEVIQINEYDTMIDDIFEEADEYFDIETDGDILEGINISAENLIYILKQNISESVPLLLSLTGGKWTADQVLGLKKTYEQMFGSSNSYTSNYKSNHNKSNRKKLQRNNNNDNNEDYSDSNDTQFNKKVQFDFEWDSSDPNYRQFMELYNHPNKYKRIKLLQKVYWKKLYSIFVELIYLTIDVQKQLQNKNKKKIYAKDSFHMTPTTLWYRKLLWFLMLFNIAKYKALTMNESEWSKQKIIPKAQKALKHIYEKNKNKIKTYKYSFDKPFVLQSFAAIGDGWEFAKNMQEPSTNNEPKKRGRRKRER